MHTQRLQESLDCACNALFNISQIFPFAVEPMNICNGFFQRPFFFQAHSQNSEVEKVSLLKFDVIYSV